MDVKTKTGYISNGLTQTGWLKQSSQYNNDEPSYDVASFLDDLAAIKPQFNCINNKLIHV